MYRIPTVTEAQARAVLFFKAQPNAGDTVSIGDFTYTFRTALTDPAVPFEVLIGADTNATATNLANALTTDSGTSVNAGVQYGTATALNIDVKYTLPDTTPIDGMVAPSVGVETISAVDYVFLLIGAVGFGASFNAIQVSESTSAARLLWTYDTLDFAHTTSTYLGGVNATFNTDVEVAATWLEFNDPDTNVFKSPIANDEWNRFYAVSPSQRPTYNTYDRIVANDPFWVLGVPAPGCAVSLTVTGGGNTQTLGNTTTDGSGVVGFADTMYLLQITPAGDTQITDIRFATQADSDELTVSHFAGVLYDDNNGSPGTLLNTGQIVTGIVPGGNTSAFLNPSNLFNNTPYWIGILVDDVITYAGGPVEGGVFNVVSRPQVFTNGPPGEIQSGDVTTGLPGIQLFADLLTSDVLESRAYTYTWVSEYGEEGPPAPPTILDGWSNGVWTLGLWQPPPNDLGILRNLKKLNIYRTVPGAGGQTVFFYVTTLDIGAAEYVDTISNDVVALNDQLLSTNWFPPPENLEGVVVMPNGVVAGFVNNEVWFCEPYRPHAWPPGYVLTVDYPIVGLGVTGGALVVCTSTTPFVITGVTPGQMTQTKCNQVDPCASRGSILGGDNAVTYMSPNGLIQVTPSGIATNTTDLWFTREQWHTLTPPANTRAILLASCYYCLGSVSSDGTDSSQALRGFTIELAQDNTSFTIWPQPGGHRLGFMPLSAPTGFATKNILTDPWTGIGLIVADGKVWWIDFSDTAPTLHTYIWRSKTYQQNTKRNYSAMKAYFAGGATLPTLNPVRLEAAADDPVWNTLPSDRWGFIKSYADTDSDGEFELVDCREIRSSGELMRIVGGFKSDIWAWQILARVPISNIQIGTSVKDLAQT